MGDAFYLPIVTLLPNGRCILPTDCNFMTLLPNGIHPLIVTLLPKWKMPSSDDGDEASGC